MEQANKWKWTHNIRKLLELQGQAMQRRMYFTFDYLQFDEDKKDFYKFTLALDALKKSLDGTEKTVILDGNSDLAQILTGSK